VETSDREFKQNGDLAKQDYNTKEPAETVMIMQNVQKPPLPIAGIDIVGDQKRFGSAMPR
jgi:hypothetical protein